MREPPESKRLVKERVELRENVTPNKLRNLVEDRGHSEQLNVLRFSSKFLEHYKQGYPSGKTTLPVTNC